MGRRFIYIFLLLAVCLSSCRKGEHVIPRSKMAKIYAEMFITDQKLTGQPSSIRAVIDTSWVYEPIFEKYGYTSDDYRASVDYYIHDATRFARIVRRSTLIIEDEIRELQKRKALLEKLEAVDSISYEPERVFYLTGIDNPNLFGNDTLRFYVDSTGGKQWFDPRDWADTAYYGPIMRVLEDEIIAAAEEDEALEETEDGAVSEVGGVSGNNVARGSDDGVGGTSERRNARVLEDEDDDYEPEEELENVPTIRKSDNVGVGKSAASDTLKQKRRVRKGRAVETETADETKSVKVSRNKNKENE